ncbi:hypothetical protein LINGRAHAP2_LOCUS33448 [Linum grandiflorum]
MNPQFKTLLPFFLPCPFHLKKNTPLFLCFSVSLFLNSSRMEFTTELSLASSSSSRKFIDSETSSESGTNNGANPKKRKTPSSFKHSSIDSNNTTDLHRVMMDNNHRRPLPLDWEQCLDLHSGMMYYMNRKTSRKSWNVPSYKDDVDDDLNLELNISSNYSSSNSTRVKKVAAQSQSKDDGEKGCNNMVALACSNCHLLVILSKSSPSCPNCKYIHALNPTLVHSSRPKSHLSNNNDVDQRHAPHKSINNTLSLLN